MRSGSAKAGQKKFSEVVKMKEKDFVAYEYATKKVSNANKIKAIDLYESFGWEVTGTTPAQTLGSVTLSLRRDRKIAHRQELVKLQREAEELVEVGNKLEKSKTFGASVFAYIFGCVAALVLGGGMSLVMTVGGLAATIGGVALGVVGLVGCTVNYPIYAKIADRKTRSVLPLIDDNDEKIADTLEKGNDLLKADEF